MTDQECIRYLESIGYRVSPPKDWFLSLGESCRKELIALGVNPHAQLDSRGRLPGIRKGERVPDAFAEELAEAGVTQNIVQARESPEDRRKRAYDARESGETWAEVGKRLGVGNEQARQLAMRHERDARLAQRQKDDAFLKNKHGRESIDVLGLSFGLRNSLMSAGIHHVGDLISMRSVELLKLPGIGAMSLREIEQATSRYTKGNLRSAQ